MISKYRKYKLKEVASFERAKKGIIYPRGTTLVQISASKGEVEYLEKESEVTEGKYAAVIPGRQINPKYLNIVINREIAHFCSQYQSGLNIQIKDIGEMVLEIHDSREIQDTIATNFKIMEAEEEAIDREVSILTTLKDRFLRDLFV